MDAADLAVAFGGQSSPPRVINTSSGSWLAVAFPAQTRAHGLGLAVIQVSVPMRPINDVLDRVLVLFVLGSAVVLLLTTGAGLYLTKRSLRPLHQLGATAGQLAAGDLRARTRTDRDDEVGVLAKAFDDMAERIEELFTAQQESEQQVRRFIADASHELRTPITALKGYIDIMKRGAGRDPASLDSILASMSLEADRMRLLILDLLTLARIDALKKVESGNVDVRTLVARVLDEGVPNMPGAIERNLGAGPAVADVEENALETVLRNLLVNACKYAPGAPQEWTVSTAKGHVMISVHDHGLGIPAADLPHVFERFYRGEKTRAREEGGTGLGLSIVKGLVETHGGTVGVASQEGIGTTVTVTLPAASDR